MKSEAMMLSVCVSLVVLLGVSGFFYTAHLKETLTADYTGKVNALQGKLD